MSQRNPFVPVRFVLIIFILISVLGCSLMKRVVPDKDQSSPDSGETLPMDQEDADVNVKIMDETYEPEPYEYPRLGSISFREDVASGRTMDVKAGQEAAELQVTDTAGVSWTLAIPAGALDTDQTIRITPLTDLQSTEINGVISGIALEPDGIEFLRPVELRVSGAKLNAHTLILAGDRTGADVDVAMQDISAHQPKARITHFSTYFATSFTEQDFFTQWYKWSSEEYKKAAQEAKKLLKEDIRVPEPPSISLECPDDEQGEENGQKLQDYLEKFRQPEVAMINRLLAMKRIMVMSSSHPEEIEQVTNLEIRLAYRQLKKAKMLMDQYYGSEDKIWAVSQVVLDAMRQVQLLDYGQPNDANITSMMTELSKWYDGLVDGLLKDIEENHNYKKIPLVIEIYRRGAMLTGNDYRSEELIERMRRALKFEVQVHVDLHYPEESYITDTTVTVQFDVNDLTHCSGSGTGDYTSITSPHATVETAPYPVQVVVQDFDPCNGKVTVGFDRFGATSETYTIDPDNEPLVQEMPLVQNAGEALFADHADAGMYLFEMKLDNGNPVAAEETFDASKYGKVSAEVTLKLVHTPE